MSEIAADAIGARRRIVKGQNRRIESRRFNQLCQWLELTATSLQGHADDCLRLQNEVPAYLEALEKISQDDHLEGTEFWQSFYQDGFVLEAKAEAIKAMDSPELDCVVDFFEQASSNSCSVVEIMSFALLASP